MASKEEISMIGFTIIAFAGDAKTFFLNAIEEARNGNFDKAKNLLSKGSASIVEAHNEQTKLLSEEAGGIDLDVTFIMVHAQDSLMTTILLRDQTQYFIDIYEELYEIKQRSIENGKSR